MAMKRVLAGLGFAIVGLGVAACDQQGDAWDGQTLRAAGEDVEFWNFRPNDPGNGDVDLSDGGGDDGLPPTLDWGIDGDGDSSDVFDPNGELVVSTIENQIFDAGGSLQCTAYLEGDLFKLREGVDGEVVLTATVGRYVFWGDVDALPEPGTYAWQHLIYHQLGYEFHGDVLYDGPRWIADVIAHADVHIHKASPMRKLLIAALYEGACGSADTPVQVPG